jgi:hypothetical protein
MAFARYGVTPPPCNDCHSKWPEMGYPAYVVRIRSFGVGASLAAAALGYAEGKVASLYGYMPRAPPMNR